MIPRRSKSKGPVRLFVMNAKVLKRRKKAPAFSPLTRERAMRVMVVATILATCGFGGFEVGHYLLSDPRYAVKEIIVRGNGKFSEEEIISISMLRKGENILRARIHRARERLLKFPLLERVWVTRLMPDTIVIEVVERHPRARLWGSKEILADYSGVLLPRSCCSEPNELPLVVGVDSAYLSVGDKCSQPAMRKAMRALELCQSSLLSDLVKVDGIDSSRPDDLRLYFKRGGYTQEGCEVRLGGDDFEQKLAKLKAILESVLEKHGRKISSVDLTLDNVPVRF